jgi:hypothetical protein
VGKGEPVNVKGSPGMHISTSFSANVSPSPGSKGGSGERLWRVERRV